MQFRFINARRALEYIREGLAGGCSLARYLLERLERERVRIGTWLPPTIPEEDIYRFEQGRKLPKLGWEIILPHGGRLVPIPNTVPEVARYLSHRLAAYRLQGCNALLLAADELASPSDPWIAQYQACEGTGLLFWQQEVYFYADERAPIEGVERVLQHARSLAGMFSVAVLARDVQIFQDWSPALVAQLSELFVARAYDGESFLLVKFVR